jgi:hypothetical protein
MRPETNPIPDRPTHQGREPDGPWAELYRVRVCDERRHLMRGRR